MRPVLLLVLLGCAEGPSEETLLTELRVVSIVNEPAEAAPSEPVAVTITAADPAGLGADVLVWECTPFGEGCLEDPEPVEERLVLGSLTDQAFAPSLAASAALDAYLPDDQTVVGAGVWALACEPGLCPIVDDARAALAAGGPAPIDLARDLADTRRWLDDLPLVGVSVASRTLPVSRRAVGLRNENPSLVVADEEVLVVAAGEQLDLVVTVSDDAEEPLSPEAFGYSTAGGFGRPVFDLPGGQGSLAWYAPTEEGPVELFVVVDDQDGGTALWHGTAAVE